jgi:phage terminase large subunit-like protein
MKRELEIKLSRRRIDTFYPDEGRLRRELYPKHLEFFAAGRIHRERCFLAANRIGKTEGVGAYETTLHLTGDYPWWWKGRRFDAPITAWAAGKDSKTVREIIQSKLLGPIGDIGTGMLPGDAIISTTPKPGVPEAIESVVVRHSSGGKSRLLLKSYDQGRESFQGTEQNLCWLDEECHRDIYIECLTRTMTVNGMIILTFTPLLGMTDIVRDFLGYEIPE